MALERRLPTFARGGKRTPHAIWLAAMKIRPWIAWPLWLGWCAFLAWKFADGIGATVITFLVLTVPIALWTRHQTRKQNAAAEDD